MYFLSNIFAVSEYIPCGELLALLDSYHIIPEELVKLLVAEIASAIGKFVLFMYNVVPF